MQFNQTNNNKGDVNNAISDGGNVIQAVGSENSLRVENPKDTFWTTLWKKVKSIWKG
jgi:hypothetical protein